MDMGLYEYSHALLKVLFETTSWRPSTAVRVSIKRLDISVDINIMMQMKKSPSHLA